MSGLAVAAVILLGAAFTWRLIDLIGPEWNDRVARAVGIGSRGVDIGFRWVSRWAPIAMVAPAVICLGAIAIMVGTVLPLDQPPSLGIPQTTLLRHGGWALIGLAVIAAVTGYRSYRMGSRSWGPSVLGLIALGLVVWMATDSGLRTGYFPFGFPPWTPIVRPPGGWTLRRRCRRSPGLARWLAPPTNSRGLERPLLPDPFPCRETNESGNLQPIGWAVAAGSIDPRQSERSPNGNHAAQGRGPRRPCPRRQRVTAGGRVS